MINRFNKLRRGFMNIAEINKGSPLERNDIEKEEKYKRIQSPSLSSELAKRIGRSALLVLSASSLAILLPRLFLSEESMIPKIVGGLVGTIGTWFFATKEYDNWRNELERANYIKDKNTRKTMLFLRPKADWNGGPSCIYDTDRSILEKLSEEYAIFERRVGCVDDINLALEEMKSKNKTVNLLWLRAHGSKDSMHLGYREGEVKYYNDGGINPDGTLKYYHNDVRSIRFDQLDPEATILLNACSVGKPNPHYFNFCEQVQLSAGPKRKVYGPKKSISVLALQLMDPKKLTFKFKTGTPSEFFKFKREDITCEPNFEECAKWKKKIVCHGPPHPLTRIFGRLISKIF